MYIKIKFIDASLKSCLLPIHVNGSSYLKVTDGTKLEVTPIQFADIVQACNGSKKILIQEIEAKEFKELKEVPKEQAKEAK